MDLNSWVEYNAKPLRGDSENKFSIDSFERELNACMSELEYIRPSHQNSIEVLFEAQRALESSQSIPHDTSTMADTTSHINTEHFAMLDDPITLLKLLKAKGPFSSAPPQGGQHG